MSVKKEIVNLLPLLDLYEKEIDPYMGIDKDKNVKEELITTEVMLIMGVNYQPEMKTLRTALLDNISNNEMYIKLITAFTNMAYSILSVVDYHTAREIVIRPLRGYMLEVSYHVPMTVEQIDRILHEHKY